MRCHRRAIAFAAVVGLATVPAFAQSSAEIGRVKVTAGQAFIVRGSETLAAQAGAAILESDALRTGADGRLGIILRDDTRVSLGPGSEVRVSSFLYTPGEGRLALVLRFVRGLAVYVSGKIAALAPDSVQLETPDAIVGVRGTTLIIRVTE
jgi:hypothetical protein